jgi:hypothetical protein
MSGEWGRSSFTVDASGSGHTAQNVINAFTSFLTQLGWQVPGWSSNTLDRYFIRSDSGSSDVWDFNGDGPTQRCGIRITYESGNSRFRFQPFLQNSGATGDQITVQNDGSFTVTWDTTAPNMYVVIGGEFGISVECGKSGNPSNLGLGFIGTQLAIPEFNGVRNATRLWTTQGFGVNLGAALNVFYANSYWPNNDGSSHPYTMTNFARFARGSSSAAVQTMSNNTAAGLSNRMFRLGAAGRPDWTSNAVGNTGVMKCSLGVPWSPTAGKYAVSGLTIDQFLQGSATNGAAFFINSAAGQINGASMTTYQTTIDDFRELRQVKKFAAVDYQILPWTTIQDPVTGVYYRAQRYNDQGGRYGNIAVEWPSTVITVTL